MHIFLTGPVQVGKSTILRRWLAAHPDLRVGGFYTVAGEKRGGIDSVYLVPAAKIVPLRSENRVLRRSGDRDHRKLEVFSEVFDRVGTAILAETSGCDLILMDEIGHTENAAHEFQRTVLRQLDGNTPVLGVVQERSGVLSDAVRSHKNVETILVTPENREAVLERLLLWKP